MSELFRFSPILDGKSFHTALWYLARQSALLAELILGQKLAIDTLTIFSHFPEELAFLDHTVRRFGPVSPATHGETLYVDADFTVDDHRIHYLGVREPDSTRPQVGYADYPVDDYDDIKVLSSPYVREITSGRGQKLLELRHPDFDVFGYITRKEDRLCSTS